MFSLVVILVIVGNGESIVGNKVDMGNGNVVGILFFFFVFVDKILGDGFGFFLRYGFL